MWSLRFKNYIIFLATLCLVFQRFLCSLWQHIMNKELNYCSSPARSTILTQTFYTYSRLQSSRGLRLTSTAARLLRSWIRIPPGAWIFVVSVVCCHVEVSATSWSLVQSNPADCVVSLCMIKKKQNLVNVESQDTLGCYGAKKINK